MYDNNVLIAFAVGFASFLSPCILPIIPGFVSSLAGTICQDDIKKTRKAIFLSTVFFVLGLAVTFAILGTIISCLCGPGSVFGVQLKNFMTIAGGFVIVGFGTFLILTSVVPRLNFQILINEKLKMKKATKQQMSYVSSWVLGTTFGAAWTPCVGPLLGSILALAATNAAMAYNSLLAYALGLGIPFLIVGAFFAEMTPIIKKMVKYTKHFDIVMGGILIVVGILLLTGLIGNV